MDISGFGWRDGVLLLAAVAAVYLLLTLLRLVSLRRRRAAEASAEMPSGVGLPAESALTAQWPSQWPAQWSAPPPANEEPEPEASFDEHLAGSRLDLEVRQLREEVTTLRREIGELKAARRVSPQYADAMALARRGYDAQGIAAECGIAVAEAELVLAMSRDEMQFDEEVDHGRHVRDAAGSTGQ